MAPYMQRVLVTFCLILVFEPVSTVVALILFLGFMRAVGLNIMVSWVSQMSCCQVAYVSSSRVSNFFGFLGQQSHI